MADQNSSELPLLFLHGVGGLPTYLEMLLQLTALNHPVVVVQFQGVSMRWGPVRPVDAVVQQVVGVMDTLGVTKACVVGHSYGTFVASRLRGLHPEHVKSMCLLDPVCLAMFMPNLLSAFLYSTPTWTGLYNIWDYIKKLAVYFISRELHVCATFSRTFFWTDLCIWPEDLPPGSVVLLSGRDDLMDPQLALKMMQEQPHIKVHFTPDLTHGEFVFKPKVMQTAMQELKAMIKRGRSVVVGPAYRALSRTLTAASSVLHHSAWHVGVLQLRVGGAGGSRHVEDHSRQLMRTFTGNITAALHKLHSNCSSFGGCANGGNISRGSSSRSTGSWDVRSEVIDAVLSSGSGSSSGGSSIKDTVCTEQPASRMRFVSSPH